jgi:RNA polymerase sigma factor (sigma-70 family)
MTLTLVHADAGADIEPVETHDGAQTLDQIGALIDRATALRAAHTEKSDAFGEIVRRFQDMAFGCAYAVLGDFYLAEDAAQEAFLSAWRNLDQLREPKAFPGWLKRIVLTQCNRLTRNKQLELVALEEIEGVPAPAHEADVPAIAAHNDQQARVLAAIQSLPENERMVTALFYLGDCTANEIAGFLELPLTTVKKRLHTARHKLRERMTDMDEIVRDTLKDKRPSRNDQFAGTVKLFNEALESFVGKVKQDRYVIAAILFGSLSHDTVWAKSDIDIMLVGREEKPVRSFSLIENGVNIHATLWPRSKFKQALEGSLQGDMMHSSFALSTLLFTTDDTIRAYYQDARKIGARDAQLRLLSAGQSALYTLAKAEKWLYTRKDVAYSFLWLMYCVNNLAAVEVLLHGELTSREVIPQALKLNPGFFNRVYLDLVNAKKDEAMMQRAIDLVNAYIESKIYTLFGPVLDYLHEAGGTLTTSELDAYFKKQVQDETLCGVYEWLAFKGVIQKVPSPVRLTQRSAVTLDEAAYYYDGGVNG